MKYLPFRILVLCLLSPPLLYIFSVQYMEQHLQAKYHRELENTYLGNVGSLLDGTADIKETIPANIRKYLSSKALLAHGVDMEVYVATKKGTLIYPPPFDEGEISGTSDRLDLASENFRLMNEGITVAVDLKIMHFRTLANLFMTFSLIVPMAALYFFYARGVKKARREEQAIERKIGHLEAAGENNEKNLMGLKREKDTLVSEYETLVTELEKERKKATSNEEDMIGEIVSLEEKIAQNLARQEAQQKEIEILRDQLARYEKAKTRKKTSDAVGKRFAAIYKQLTFMDKALDGFEDLTESMKIKAEEIIHQLNSDPSLVTVKRKVFGKKGRETVFEVVFAYKGRLYYRRLKDGKIEIVTMGTKNDQERDLGFLDRL